jgi:cytoskeletal protein CcmA (bactofilin family)
MSVFCAHCRKRLILEDYNIKSYQAVAGYATCGDVIVHKQGRVAAPIQAANLTVKGVVQGKVRVRGRVEIAATGTLTGSVSAPSITVSDGARLEAYCEIRPEPPASEVKPAGVITEGEAPKPPGTAKAVRVTSTKAKSKEPDASPAKAAAQVKSISTRRRAGTKVSS